MALSGLDRAQIDFTVNLTGLFEAGEAHARQLSGCCARRDTPFQGIAEIVTAIERPEDGGGEGVARTDGRDGVDAGRDGLPDRVLRDADGAAAGER